MDTDLKKFIRGHRQNQEKIPAHTVKVFPSVPSPISVFWRSFPRSRTPGVRLNVPAVFD
jgi:hypothetical protein